MKEKLLSKPSKKQNREGADKQGVHKEEKNTLKTKKETKKKKNEMEDYLLSNPGKKLSRDGADKQGDT